MFNLHNVHNLTMLPAPEKGKKMKIAVNHRTQRTNSVQQKENEIYSNTTTSSEPFDY